MKSTKLNLKQLRTLIKETVEEQNYLDLMTDSFQSNASYGIIHVHLNGQIKSVRYNPEDFDDYNGMWNNERWLEYVQDLMIKYDVNLVKDTNVSDRSISFDEFLSTYQ